MTFTPPPPATGTSVDDVRRTLGLTSIGFSVFGFVAAAVACIGSSLDRQADEFGLGFFVAGTTAIPAAVALGLGIFALRSRNVSAAMVAGIVGVALGVEPIKGLGLWTLGLFT